VTEAEARLRDFKAERAEVDVPTRIGWSTFHVARDVTDPAALDSWKIERPFLLTLRYDTESKANKGQLTALGGIQFFAYRATIRDSTLDKYFDMGLAMDLDSDATKPKNESSIKFSLPLNWLAVGRYGEPRWINSFGITMAPSFGTDRAFNREVYAASVGLVVASKKLNAGYFTYVSGGRVRLYWAPAVAFTVGKVEDAAGNAKLAAIESLGAYYRVVPKLSVSVDPKLGSRRLVLGCDYSHTFDLGENWNHEFAELSASYGSGLSLALYYRRGFKPPDFTKTSEFLFGIGLIQ